MPPRYTDEFKREAARQVLQNNYSIRETADRLGVHYSSLKQWVKQYGDPQAFTQQQNANDEIRRLKAELKRVTEERDILKKAAAYFAKDHG
jgi:transposase